MEKRDYGKMRIIIYLLLFLSTALSAVSNPNESPPNIILIVTDDLGWSDLGSYGNEFHETPNLDAFAKESLRFTNAYAAAPVCTPTRASLMTGKYPARLQMTVWSENARGEHGITKDQKLVPASSVPDLPLSEITIAEALKERGYNTAHIGKWHLGESMFYPENQGYDINIAGGSWGCPATFFYPYRGPFGGSIRYIPDLERSGVGNRFLTTREKDEYLTDRLTDETIQIISDGVAAGSPFFISLNYYSVHTPIEAPENIVNYYKEKAAQTGSKRNPAYAAMVHVVDQNVGKILRKLKELKIEDNTLVVFTSDHGAFINKHRGVKVADNTPLRSGKGSLYEGGLRVPLIVRYPGFTPEGETCDTPVITNDFYATFCEAAGIEEIQLNDGLSLFPLLRDPNIDLGRDDLFWHYPHYYPTTSPVSAVRYKQWKLLKYYEDDRIELYDLEKDLSEKQDLASKKPQLALELLAKLEDWLDETKAEMPSLNSHYKAK